MIHVHERVVFKDQNDKNVRSRCYYSVSEHFYFMVPVSPLCPQKQPAKAQSTVSLPSPSIGSSPRTARSVQIFRHRVTATSCNRRRDTDNTPWRCLRIDRRYFSLTLLEHARFVRDREDISSARDFTKICTNTNVLSVS